MKLEEMPDPLSITNVEPEISLCTSKEDLFAAGIKTVGGFVPFGSAFAEILSVAIPNQKLERVANLVDILNYKIQTAERKIEEVELKTQEFTDLFEDGVIQASRSLTRERLDHIASVLKNSIIDNELDHLGKKKLLSLLGQLNDAEIIWLKSYSFRLRSLSQPDYKEYFAKHRAVLEPITPGAYYRNPPRDVVNKIALAESYTNNLIGLNLIKEKFNRVDKLGPDPDFDEETGKLKSEETVCTDLGRMLLDYLDLGLKNEPAAN